MVKGLYNPRQELPLVPCSDGVGRIIERGSEVTQFEVGDRVIGAFAPQWQKGPPDNNNIRNTLGGPLPGMLCQERILPQESIVKVPDYLTDTQAATLPCAALTAYNALILQGNIKKGQTELTLGSGGVCFFISIRQGQRGSSRTSNIERSQGERLKLLGLTTSSITKPPPSGRGPWKSPMAKALITIRVGGSGTLEQSLKAIKVGEHQFDQRACWQ